MYLDFVIWIFGGLCVVLFDALLQGCCRVAVFLSCRYDWIMHVSYFLFPVLCVARDTIVE